MSQWNRTTLPTEADADEFGNILVMYATGPKAVHHWEDYIDNHMMENGDAWMTLPETDFPESVSVTIEVGEVTYTIENNGFTIEVHDSRDPMGQPAAFQHDGDIIGGILEAVDGILQEELHPERARSAEVVNDVELQSFIDGFIDGISGKKSPKKQESCQCKCRCKSQSDLEFVRYSA